MTTMIDRTGQVFEEPLPKRPVANNKGPKFTKVYDRGWSALRTISGNSTALKVYLFLCEQAGHDNALVCSVETIAEELEVSVRTIIRATSTLQKGGHIAIAKIGTANAYILNPEEVWKTYEDHKRFCSFSAQALISKEQNKMLKRRLTHMISSKEGQRDFFEEESK